MSFYFGTYDFRFHTNKTNNSLIGNVAKSDSSSSSNQSGSASQGSQSQGGSSQGNPSGAEQPSTGGQGTPASAEKPVITVEKVDGGYDVKVDGSSAGVITIPNDKHLKTVTFDETSKSLKFVLDVDGEQEVLVPLTMLSDEYQKGNGLELNDKTFSIKLSSNSEPYLTVTEEGLSLAGLDEKLNEKLTKEQADTLYVPIGSAQGGGVSEEQLNEAVDNAKTELNQVIEGKANTSDIKTYTAGNGLQLNDTEFSVSEELGGLPEKVTTIEGKVEDIEPKVQALEGGNFATKEEVSTAKTEVLDTVEETYIKKTDEKSFELESDGLVHTIKFGGQTVGTINIPKDLFATSLEFDQATNMLKIKVNNADGDAEQVVSVDMSSLIDTYTAGTGLQLSDKEFSLSVEFQELPTKVQTLEGKVGELEQKNTEQDTEISNIKTTFITINDADGKFALKEEIKTYTAGNGISVDDTVISLGAEVSEKVVLIDNKLDSSVAEETYVKKAEVVEYTSSNGVRKVGNDFQLEEEYVELPTKVQTLETEKLSVSVAETTYAKKVDLEDIIRRLGVVEANYNTLNEKYTELQGKYEQLKGVTDQHTTDIEELKQRQPMEEVPVE